MDSGQTQKRFSIFEWLNNRISKTRDNEPEQALKIRLPVASLFVIIFCIPWSGQGSFWENISSFPGLIFFNHLIMAIVIVIALRGKKFLTLSISPYRKNIMPTVSL